MKNDEAKPELTVPAYMKQDLAVLVDEIGLFETAKKIGVGREAIARILGGLPVRAGTIVLIREWLKTSGRDGETPRRSVLSVEPGRPSVKEAPSVARRPKSGPVTATIGEIVGKERTK